MHQIDSFLSSFISTLIGVGQRQFCLSISIRGDFYANGQEVEVPTRFVHLLIDGRSNYVGVWTRISTVPKILSQLRGEDFTFRSCHDSCWRSDGMRWLSETFCEMRSELEVAIKERLPEISLPFHDLNARITSRPDLCFFQPVTFESVRRSDGGYSACELRA